MAKKDEPLNKVDRHYGYRLGCDGFVTRKSVAETLGHSEKSVDNMLADGDLRWVKLPNGRIRICKRSLDVLIGRCEQTNVQL